MSALEAALFGMGLVLLWALWTAYDLHRRGYHVRKTIKQNEYVKR